MVEWLVSGADGAGAARAVQEALLIGWHEVPSAPGHVFYDRLNAVLDEAGFDREVEAPYNLGLVMRGLFGAGTPRAAADLRLVIVTPDHGPLSTRC